VGGAPGGDPYPRPSGAIAERLRRPRHHLTGDPGPTSGRYADAADLTAELGEIQRSLVAAGLSRVASGSVQDFCWQVETFGFHLAELEVRQHADIHRAAVVALRARAGSGGPSGGRSEAEIGPGATLSAV